MSKSKSMRGSDGGRKLAADHGRGKQKSGGEAKKQMTSPRGTKKRADSAKKAK